MKEATRPKLTARELAKDMLTEQAAEAGYSRQKTLDYRELEAAAKKATGIGRFEL